jgi:hypothetical protein
MRGIGLVCAGLLCAGIAMAQNETPLGSEFRREGGQFKNDCGEFKTIFNCLEDVATGKPLHLTLGSIAPLNGMGFGPAFVWDRNVGESWRTSWNADAIGATSGSWRAGVYFKAIRVNNKPPKPIILQHRPTGQAAHQPATTLQSVPEFNVYAQAISLNTVDFYGPGPASPRGTPAVFGMREVITGANVTYPLCGTCGLAAFGELNGRWVDIRPGVGIPSPPGQTGFLQPAEGLLFARALSDKVHLTYSATIQEFVAGSGNSFERLNLGFLHEIPLHHRAAASASPAAAGPDESPVGIAPKRYTYNREGTVGLEARVVESFTPAGNSVPFYFQPTLGGADLNGATALASYADYRFRAPNLMLFRASVEHSIWGPIGLLLTADTGKVALTRGDLGFSHLRHSYGAGITLRAGGFPMVQLLFAWGGHEGTHNIAAISPVVLGGSGRPSLY